MLHVHMLKVTAPDAANCVDITICSTRNLDIFRDHSHFCIFFAWYNSYDIINAKHVRVDYMYVQNTENTKPFLFFFNLMNVRRLIIYVKLNCIVSREI